MDAPPVQYVKTSDGYDIAYTVSGEGRPLLLLPGRVSHVQLHWGIPSSGAWFEALSREFRLIHYDARGQGLSTRGLPRDFSFSDYDHDLEAVIREVGLQRFILMAPGIFGHVAVRYAVAHAEQIEALVLVNSVISTEELKQSALMAVVRQNWELALRNVSQGYGWDDAQRRDAVERFRQSVLQEDLIIANDASVDSDISALLPKLNVPVLLLHARHRIMRDINASTRLASLIPRAQLTVIDGYNFFGDEKQGVPAIKAFIEQVMAEKEDSNLAGVATTREGISATQEFAADVGQDRDVETRANTFGLSDRETEVLRLLVSGKSNPQIAAELTISPSTVAKHVMSIYRKTETANRVEVTAHAHRHQLI